MRWDGITWSWSPWATKGKTGRPASRPGVGGDAGVEGKRNRRGSRRHRELPACPAVEAAREGSSAAETGQHHRAAGGRDLVEPGAEPGHRFGQGLGDRASDPAGEPREATALGDRADWAAHDARRKVCGRSSPMIRACSSCARQQHERGGGVNGRCQATTGAAKVALTS